MKKMQWVTAMAAAALFAGMLTGCGQEQAPDTTAAETAAPESVNETESAEQSETEQQSGEQAAEPEITFSLSWAPAYDEQHGLTQAALQADAKIKELS